jgi:sulfite exporter TauE/SafE
MFKKVMTYWIVGAAIAFSGVAMARFFAPAKPVNVSLIVKMLGYMIAFFGLFIITLGTGKKAKERAAEHERLENEIEEEENLTK